MARLLLADGSDLRLADGTSVLLLAVPDADMDPDPSPFHRSYLLDGRSVHRLRALSSHVLEGRTRNRSH